jgi:heme oxygenase
VSDWREEINAEIAAAEAHVRRAMELARENDEEDVAHSFGIVCASLAHFQAVAW